MKLNLGPLHLCWFLAHLTRDLSQAEKMHEIVTTTSLKSFEVAILSKNSCHFVSL